MTWLLVAAIAVAFILPFPMDVIQAAICSLSLGFRLGHRSAGADDEKNRLVDSEAASDLSQ